jgi:hypothetical protein
MPRGTDTQLNRMPAALHLMHLCVVVRGWRVARFVTVV